MFYVRRFLLNQSTASRCSLIAKNIQSEISLTRYLSIAETKTDYNNVSSLVNISESCVKKLKAFQNTKQYLRVSVEAGGCSGFNYKFSLDTPAKDEDLFIEKDSVKILIDKESIDYLKGSTIDFHEELIRAGFRVLNNPNSEQGCSCGTSFSIKI